MPLFQPSVLKKYLQQQDSVTVQKAYKKYVKYFHNTTIQANIRSSKEEQFQEGFLRELFVEVLGYTLNPTPKYNLTTELKNIKGAKKVDGAILKDGEALGVIELKGSNTKDLESIRQQAFDYKANQTGCIYVITSNFEKLRFYINNAVDYEEFDLFRLTEKEFEFFYLCLSKDNILANKPLKIKEDSIVEEENITKKFYADYSLFKRELYRDLVKQNRNNVMLMELTEKTSRLTLFKKSQKLIDRFLFILFAEDRGLLAPNSINTILKEWKALEELDIVVPLYDRYKQYFNYLDTGRKGSDKKEEIFAYNGGLFQTDAILDAVVIDDDLLYRHTKKLSTYDFESQVDVNILGHIFEHSLNEIESVNAEIEGTDFDKQKTKRKKDGVFYTPKYITKYIVDNTIGKLCSEKKLHFGIVDEEYSKGRKNRQATTILKLDQQLKDYREWLLQLTICDIACGSGAFLNQALDFLIKEHSYIDELNKQLFGGGFAFPDIENQILEHNIYGVDLNDESVEIAKLSLWLRTAQPKRKLTSLNSNIKCGNSVIDSKSVAGNKAFNWKDSFPEVFAKGGFDVIIGNPPYVNLEKIKETSEALEKKGYKTYNKKGDLYCIFVEKGFELLKPNGLFSFIMPNKWLQAGYGRSLREYFLNYKIIQLIDFGDIQIFEGATTYPCIFISQKSNPNDSFRVSTLKKDILDFDTNVISSQEIFETSKFNGDTWVISSNMEHKLLSDLKIRCQSLEEFVNGEAYYGIKFGLTEAFLINDDTKNKLIAEDHSSESIIGSILRGRNLKRYGKPDELDLDNIILASFGSYKYLENEYPAVFRHLLQYEDRLKQRGQCNGSKVTVEKPFAGQHHWLELDNNPSKKYLDLYRKPKIMYQKFQVKPCFIYDDHALYCNDSMWIIPSDNKALLGVLNSKMGWWLISKFCTQIQNGCQLIWKYFGLIPIPKILSLELSILVDTILNLNIELSTVNKKFIKYFSGQLNIDKLSNKLQNWHELSFSDFIKELNKAIKTGGGIPLTKKDEIDWMDVFEDYKRQAQNIKQQIDKTDKEIDSMVYELYGLSKEEISVVENS
jgi:type I restriction-modification system DNA methylase subunit